MANSFRVIGSETPRTEDFTSGVGFTNRSKSTEAVADILGMTSVPRIVYTQIASKKRGRYGERGSRRVEVFARRPLDLHCANECDVVVLAPIFRHAHAHKRCKTQIPQHGKP